MESAFLHSKDDDTISLNNSLLAYKDKFVNPERIQTILYDNKSHDVVKSDEAIKYSEELSEDTVYTQDVINTMHELDENVMQSILNFYDSLL